MLLIPAISWLACSSILMSFLPCKELWLQMHAYQALKTELVFKNRGKTDTVQSCFLCLETVQAGERRVEWSGHLG